MNQRYDGQWLVVIKRGARATGRLGMSIRIATARRYVRRIGGSHVFCAFTCDDLDYQEATRVGDALLALGLRRYSSDQQHNQTLAGHFAIHGGEVSLTVLNHDESDPQDVE